MVRIQKSDLKNIPLNYSSLSQQCMEDNSNDHVKF